MYPRPDIFDPERFKGFTDKTGQNGDRVLPLDPWDYYFGYGRRVCLGTHLAQASAWLAMASILSAFELRAKDPAALLHPEFCSEGILR